MRVLTVFLCLLILTQTGFAQPPEVLWTRNYGGAGNEQGLGIIETREGGLAFVGNEASFDGGGTDGWIVVLNEDGEELWSANFGGAGYDRFADVIQREEDWIVAGYNGSIGNGMFDFWLARLDNEGNLDGLILDGRTEPPHENGFVETATYWRDYMYGQHNRAEAGQSAQLVNNVNLNDKQTLLDLGGGLGSYSIALCKANPQLQADLIDVKEPLEMARNLIEKEQVSDQITLIEGDFNTIDLDQDYDAVLISGVICIKSRTECRAVLQRAYHALKPDGIVIIQDFMQLDHSLERNFHDQMMNLYLKLAFDPGACDYEGKTVRSWLEKAGFINVKLIPLPTQLGIITARKPQ